eukprot:1108372-Amphidinium_carterae.1
MEGAYSSTRTTSQKSKFQVIPTLEQHPVELHGFEKHWFHDFCLFCLRLEDRIMTAPVMCGHVCMKKITLCNWNLHAENDLQAGCVPTQT